MNSGERAITDRFALESRVGAGSFGEVFRALDRETGQVVAVKRLHAHTSDPIAAQRFHQEARLLARVHNSHVVRYLAHGTDDEGRLCLALEWLEGKDLARRQRSAPLTLAEVLDVVAQGAEGLAALHDHGIVHRDVKPSNFFLLDRDDGKLHVKLIDLGIARALSEEAITLEGFRVGTPAYMSPEQARGDASITALTDIYSLGVVLFELLARRRPFTGRDPFAVLAQIVLQQPPRLLELVPTVPVELDHIVQRAMSRDLALRYQDIRAMADAVRRVEPPDASSGVAEVDATLALTPQLAVATAEQRVVTALFAGFKGAASETDPFERFEQIVVGHGGVAHRTLGRRAVAVFGIERSSGDEAVRAARAAMESSRAMQGARVALATCRVLTNAAGLSAEAIERGATQLEKPGDVIRVDATTARMLENHFRIEVVEGDSVLRGERTSIDESGPQLFGRATPFVGRDRELMTLDAFFAECVSEPVARGILLTGQGGVGKSRIRYEWAKKLRARENALVMLTARGDPVTARSPFGLLARAFRSYARIVDGEPLEKQRERVRDVLLRSVRASDRDRVGAFLGEMIGVPFEIGEHDALRAARADSMLRGDAMRAALEDWIATECEDGPVMFVFEELQWADTPSLKAIDGALRNLADRPLVVLAVGRSDQREAYRAALPNATQEITVGPLTKKPAQKLVREMLPETAPDALVDRIVERAEGNPFHLEELMRAVVSGQGEELPDTVLGMVQSRLDALGTEAKRVMRVASVFGLTFWRGGVVSLGGTERTQATEEWLQQLVTRELVTRRTASTVRGEVEYVFRNSLLRDAAYAMLTDEDRVQAHALAGAWLERAGSVDAASLADHYERGAERARAAHWHLVAADAALAGNDFAAAVKSAQRSVECGSAGVQAGRAHLIEAEAQRWKGDLDACLVLATQALSSFDEGSVDWYRALGEALVAASRTGKRDEVLRSVDRWRVAKPAADAISAAVATGARAASILSVTELIFATELMPSVRALGDGGVLEPSARARVAQAEAQLAIISGDLGRTLAETERSIREFQQAGDERNASLLRVNLANIAIELGRYVEAERVSREVLGSAARMNLKTLNAFAKHNLGRILGLRGDNAAGVVVERQALDYFVGQGDPRMEAFCRIYVSEMLQRLGRFADAEKEAQTAFDVSSSAAPMTLIPAAAQLAFVLLADGRADDALVAARQGLVRLEEVGHGEEGEANLRLAHAEALRATGREDEAREAIGEARRLLESRAAKISDAAVRESYLQNVAVNARTFELAQLLA
jgi:tetratricopeptide (TPR) repeat protein